MLKVINKMAHKASEDRRTSKNDAIGSLVLSAVKLVIDWPVERRGRTSGVRKNPDCKLMKLA